MADKPFDPTKPVQTRNGKPARIVCTDVKNYLGPILAVITIDNDREIVRNYTETGGSAISGQCSLDLVNVPERNSGFGVIFPPKSYKLPFIGTDAKTLEEAMISYPPSLYKDFFEIIFEDGVPVDFKFHRRGG